VTRTEAKSKEVQQTVKAKEVQEIDKGKAVRGTDKGIAGEGIVKGQEKKVARTAPVDLNSASKQELINLPGIGVVLAEKSI